ncbi:hypothetical protein EVAR_86271_1 [Eumeta japonica]|uniref:Uncharacterized protein n=1 Tax=Eumeta variegata TaxID=151549 RepID=A0A4C1UDA0_EUMVA|nr:hypothetical protein EVAR_86271_1 [Eumeta japonica]
MHNTPARGHCAGSSSGAPRGRGPHCTAGMRAYYVSHTIFLVVIISLLKEGQCLRDGDRRVWGRDEKVIWCERERKREICGIIRIEAGPRFELTTISIDERNTLHPKQAKPRKESYSSLGIPLMVNPPRALPYVTEIAHEAYGGRTPAIKMVFPASETTTEISGRGEISGLHRTAVFIDESALWSIFILVAAPSARINEKTEHATCSPDVRARRVLGPYPVPDDTNHHI